MKESVYITYFISIFFFSWNIHESKEPCPIVSSKYVILQSKTTDNWKTYFEDSKSLSKDSVNLCLVDSLIKEYFNQYNQNIQNAGFTLQGLEIDCSKYFIQIIPYKYKGNILLELSCFKEAIINKNVDWKKNYISILHERGNMHFSLSIDQSNKKILSFET
jgi:hypothetical protein